MLRNAGGGGCPIFWGKSVMEMYGSTLLALREGGWGGGTPNSRKSFF